MDWMLFDNNVMPIEDKNRIVRNRHPSQLTQFSHNLDTDFPASVCSPVMANVTTSARQKAFFNQSNDMSFPLRPKQNVFSP